MSKWERVDENCERLTNLPPQLSAYVTVHRNTIIGWSVFQREPNTYDVPDDIYLAGEADTIEQAKEQAEAAIDTIRLAAATIE